MSMQDTQLASPLSAAALTEIKGDVQALLVKVQPLLRHFDPVFIKRLTRYGPKSDAFVSEADEAVTTVGTNLPGSFDAQSFHNAVLVMHQITEIIGPLSAMVDGLEESQMLVGSFLMQNSNFVYDQLKRVQTLDPRVVPYVDEMKRRYENVHRKTNPA